LFDVLEFVVEGNTVLPPGTVELTLQPFMGPNKSFKDVEAARAALEKAYQDAGFLSVVVNLPNQPVNQGEIKLEVVQAEVGKLQVTGAQYNLPSRIAQQVPGLQAGQVPYFPQVQDELAQLQRNDLQVTPLISAGEAPDQIQVELKVEDQPAVSGNIELNSRQSFNTRRGRLEALVSYNNLFQRGHSAGLSWQYAPWRPDDANTLTAIYGFPVGRNDRINLGLTHSNTNTPTGTSLGGATLSKGDFFNLRWNHQLAAGAWPLSHSTWLGFDLKNSLDGTRTTRGVTTQKPALRYATVGLGYDLNWQGKEDASNTGFHVSVNTSFQDVSARQVDCEGVQDDQFDCKRAGAKADFMVLKIGFDHSRDIGSGWRVQGKLDAQLASGPLVSGEQYSLGGVDTVRGYYDYEQVGDVGWHYQLNLMTPTWFETASWRFSGVLFNDRGFVLLHQPLKGQVARVSLGSLGVGLRVANGGGTKVSLDVARPLFDTLRAADNGGFQTATGHDLRWEIKVEQEF
jgi:hemolysin activation/secretion protein